MAFVSGILRQPHTVKERGGRQKHRPGRALNQRERKSRGGAQGDVCVTPVGDKMLYGSEDRVIAHDQAWEKEEEAVPLRGKGWGGTF